MQLHQKDMECDMLIELDRKASYEREKIKRKLVRDVRQERKKRKNKTHITQKIHVSANAL